MLNEFKDFIARGNVMDMAVGIIMGAAMTAIVTSMVGDLLMPVIGLATGGVDFAAKFYALDGNTYATLADATAVSAPVLTYGVFIDAVINFVIIAFVIFMLVKGVNKIKAAAEKEAEEVVVEAPKTPEDIALLSEIRDLLKK